MESKQCFLCDSEAKDRCNFCMRPFCVHHQSAFDMTLCTDCVGFENTHVTGTHIIEDEDGNKIKSKAKKIVLTGEAWVRNRELISRMSDMCLEAKLIALKEAVREAELVLDFRRITLSQVENEKTTRYSKRLGRLRLADALWRKDHPNEPQPPLRSKASQAEVADATIKALMKAHGMTKEQAVMLIYQLTQKKG